MSVEKLCEVLRAFASMRVDVTTLLTYNRASIFFSKNSAKKSFLEVLEGNANEILLLLLFHLRYKEKSRRT